MARRHEPGGSRNAMYSLIRKGRREVKRVWYRRHPLRYWETRHQEHVGGLDGVGCLGLGSEGNARDYAAKWNHISALLTRYGPPAGARVLDAGCGIGWFTRRLVEFGYAVDAVDFSPAAVALARSQINHPVNWHVSSLEGYEPSCSYDLIVCVDVLFHITDDAIWRRSLQRLASLIRPGGALVIQDHLLAETLGHSGAPHVRWRTLTDYVNVLLGWKVLVHDRYTLPVEDTWKDLLLLKR